MFIDVTVWVPVVAVVITFRCFAEILALAASQFSAASLLRMPRILLLLILQVQYPSPQSRSVGLAASKPKQGGTSEGGVSCQEFAFRLEPKWL
mmetsp:Transcript_42947/g.124168  ORF Transcript_42947/g.124168 Transcript_42947/m.124168 type:complete len:93 (-) Transcript_42947:3-281(-)